MIATSAFNELADSQKSMATKFLTVSSTVFKKETLLKYYLKGVRTYKKEVYIYLDQPPSHIFLLLFSQKVVKFISSDSANIIEIAKIMYIG